MEESQRVSLSLTHVQYVKGDIVGQLLAWSSLLPIFLLVSFVTVIAFRRDLQTIVFLFGIFINEGVNVALKHLIKEPRPHSDLSMPGVFVEYGMPSSHAQFMGFFVTYFTLLLFIRVVLSEGGKDYLLKGVCALGAVCASSLCCFSRFYLSYHSISQVVYGSLLGVVIGGIWFIFVQIFIAPEFPRIYFWKFAEVLMVRDASLIPNYVWYEYTAARRETLSYNCDIGEYNSNL